MTAMSETKQKCLLLCYGVVFLGLFSAGSLSAIPEQRANDRDPLTHSSPIDWLNTDSSTPCDDSLIAQGDSPANGNAAIEEEKFLLSFNNLSIIEVLRFISKISGKNFIFDEEDLQFNVTIVSQEPTSVDNIMAALLQVLRIRNLTMLEQGNNIVIHSNKAVNRIPRLAGDGFDATPTKETELITQVFRLNNLPASKVSGLVKPMLSKDARVETLTETNHLVVTDFATNIDRVKRLVREVDSPQVRVEVGQYLVRNRSLENLVELASELMRPVVKDQTFNLIANEQSNSIFVVSTPFLVERAIALLQTLDMTGRQTRIMTMDSLNYLPVDEEGRLIYPEGEGDGLRDGIRLGGRDPSRGSSDLLRRGQGDRDQEEGLRRDSRLFDDNLRRGERPVDLPELQNPPKKFRIYKLKNRRSDNLADSLQLIADSLEDADYQQVDLIAALRSMQSIPETNSLVFTGIEAAVNEVEDLITRLDVPLRQVFIELLIFETSILNSLQFGVDWNIQGKNSPDHGFGIASNAQDASPLNLLMGTIGNAGGPATAPLVANNGLAAGFLGRAISYRGNRFLDIGSMVQALEERNDTTIVMNPKVLVEDGHTAEFFVGENVPFQTTSTTVEGSTNVERSFEYRDIGSRLTVTPFIGEGDFVTLEISQEKSSTAGEGEEQTEDPQSLAPTTLTTTTDTKVHVPNGHFVVLSGQIRDSRTYERRGVPCLGTLPCIGPLFSFTKDSFPEKLNLMIFVRPIIVDTHEAMRQLTRDQQVLYDRKSHMAIEEFKPERYKYDLDCGLEWLNPGEDSCD